MALLLASLALPAAAAQGDAPPEAPVTFLVGFHGLPDLTLGYAGHEVLFVNEAVRFAEVRTTAPAGLVAAALADPNVRYVEPELLGAAAEGDAAGAGALTPNDPQYGSQHGPALVRADKAWDTTLGDADAAVCVIDSGLRRTHEDLGGGRYLGGHDYVNGDGDPTDDQGHGTHVNGIAAATVDNALGVAGMGNVGFYHVKSLNSANSITSTNAANGMTWCADNTVARTVISMSFSFTGFSQAMQDAATYAYGAGRLLVAAAGNGACSDCITYPAKFTQVVAVTCITSASALCGFSSTGAEAELAAPGSGVLSTCFGSDADYCSKSGTSMSTPHVSGAAALAWGQHDGLTNAQLRQRLRDSAVDLGAGGHDDAFGHGRLDAKCLMDGNSPCAPPANNDFASSAPIPAAPHSAAQDTSDATLEAGEPAPCGSSMGATVWYHYTPTAPGTATVATAGSGFDTVLAAYTGSLGSLTNLACNDDAGGTAQSSVSFAVTAGTTYRIQAGGSNGATGQLNLALACLPNDCLPTAPANDDHADAIAIGSAPYSGTQTTAGATMEPGEPAPCGSPGASAWYSYTAPGYGTVTVSTAGSDFDTVLAAYTGGSLGTLAAVACNDDFGAAPQSQLSFAATPGTTYHVQAGGASGATGSLRLSLGFAQDDCGTGTEAGSSFAAATPLAEPAFCSGQLLGNDTQDWYRFDVGLGDTLTVQMAPDFSSDYDLCLHDPSGGLVSCSSSGGPTAEAVTLGPATTAGPWRARINAVSGSGTYVLLVESCVKVAGICVA